MNGKRDMMTIADSADRAALADLIARFDDAVNRRDLAEFRELWVDDSIWRIGDPRPLRVEGRDAIVKAWLGLLDNLVWIFRGSFTGILNVDGDTGTGRWGCIETGAFKRPDGGSVGYDNRAIYEDRYVKTAEGWRFKERLYLYLWLSTDNLPGDPIALGDELDAGSFDWTQQAASLGPPDKGRRPT